MEGDTAVRFVDTTLRDGSMSLWACKMTTDMIVPVARRLGEARFAAIEVIGAAFFKKLVRDLREDPFERIRRIKDLAPDTPLRVIQGRYAAAFQITAPDVYRLWAERLHANGVDETRMSDPSNTVSMWERNKAMAEAAGLRVVLNLIYSSSPKHTDEYYREKARAAAALRPVGICVKDPGGLLTPDRVRTLIPIVQEGVGEIPLEFHGHCTNGLGLLNAMEAVRLGIRIIDVAIPPLANAASLPSAIALARNLRALGYSVDIDDDLLCQVGEHFEERRAAHELPDGRPAEYDETLYGHQVPGGMISNLRFQLDLLGIQSRLDEVLEEIGRVRQDLGYPIMVTPYSQFVGTQATLNVMSGERYGQVVDEVLQYAIGMWGQEESEGVDPDVKDRLLGRPRAREIAAIEQQDISIDAVRHQLGAIGLSDDEFLLRFFSSEADVAKLKTARGPLSTAAPQEPWVALVERLATARGIRHLAVSKGPTSLILKR